MSESKDQLCSVQYFGLRWNIFRNLLLRRLTDDTDNDNNTDDTDNDNNTDNNCAQCQKEKSCMTRRYEHIINVCMKATSAKYSN